MDGNFQARIGLDFFNDSVVTLDHFLHDGPAAGCLELTQLVEVECDKLLDLKDIQPVGYSSVCSKAFGDRQALLQSDDYGSKS